METVAALPIFLFVACLLAVAGGLLVAAAVFNPKRPGAVKQMPYESGMDPVHDTRRRFDVRFHLMAIAFLLFDVELLFLYPWAVAMRQPTASDAAASSAGSEGIAAAIHSGVVSSRDMIFAGAMVFLVLLALGFLYDWRKGVFRWR
jgi:NADH-quinone oxidoreductase subunit A